MKFPSEKINAPTSCLRTRNSLKKENGPAKLKTKDAQIIFRTTMDNKENLKAFFADRGLTLSKGVLLACFYLEQQIKAGDIEIGPSGLLAKKGGR